MNTAVYYVFLYIYSCLTNDFCSDRIKHDEVFRTEVRKIWNLTLKDHLDPGFNSPLDEFLDVPCRELTEEQLERLKDIFYQIRDRWGKLPQDHFEGEAEDKVARMVITLAIFGGSARSISGVKALLNDKGCTNKKNQIHMDCLADFGSTAKGAPGAPGDTMVDAQAGGDPGFKVDFNRVVNEPGIRVCLINGHFIPYFVKPTSVFFIDLDRVVPVESLKPFQGKEVFFLDYKINQLGEECGLHSMMTILYTKIVDINPFFVWRREKHPAIDYKSLDKIRSWYEENKIDIAPLLRAQEFIAYKIF